MNISSLSMRRAALPLCLLLTFGLSACVGMSQRDQNTAVGAGVGALGGSVLTGGDPIGTIGGAVIGGVIGNQIDTRRRGRGR